ncbi:GlpF Glycerol uptake facilitator and related permeases (Major Intrinsic Protein Family) [Acidimicrobiia bacterium]
MQQGRKLAAEAIGTFWLVLGGCGSAVIAAKLLNGPDGIQLGIGLVGVSLAFGLTVLTMAYAVGHISGGHFNPAVTIGLWVSKRFPAKDVLPYVIVQVIGAILAALVIWAIASGRAGFDLKTDGLAANGYGEHSPDGFNLAAALLTEVVMTAGFLFVILGATAKKAVGAAAPVAIGLALTLIHLISIPVTNTSVNPARSTGPAVVQGGWAVGQLWMFWVAPIVGAVIAGLAWRFMSPSDSMIDDEAAEAKVA